MEKSDPAYDDFFHPALIRMQLQSVLTTNDYIAVLDTTYHYRYVNQAYKKYFNIRSDDIYGKTHADIFGETFFRQTIKPKLDACLRDKTVQYSAWYSYKKINRYINVTCYPYKPKDIIEGIIISGRDTTELKNISDKHKIQKAYFENLFQQSPDAIAILDNNDRIISVNNAFTELFGYTPEECKGNPINNLVVPDNLKKEGLEATMIVAGGQNISLDTVRKTKSGKLIHVSIIGKPILMENNQLAVYGIYRDITDRRTTEEKIKKELKEKELLLKEIHHRVKNNMQIISSLLNMQIRDIQNEKDKEIFRESQTRIKSMALIHERLYKSDDLTHISFEGYVRKVISNLLSSYKTSDRHVHFSLDIQDVDISINSAIPLGLIVNEIISNSLKHAFKKTEKPEIIIQLQKKDESFELLIRDNGSGFTEESYEKAGKRSMGLQLIETLTLQLHGSMDIQSHNGLTYMIRW
jgi:PAS domain S-box-containing protein